MTSRTLYECKLEQIVTRKLLLEAMISEIEVVKCNGGAVSTSHLHIISSHHYKSIYRISTQAGRYTWVSTPNKIFMRNLLTYQYPPLNLEALKSAVKLWSVKPKNEKWKIKIWGRSWNVRFSVSTFLELRVISFIQTSRPKFVLLRKNSPNFRQKIIVRFWQFKSTDDNWSLSTWFSTLTVPVFGCGT